MSGLVLYLRLCPIYELSRSNSRNVRHSLLHNAIENTVRYAYGRGPFPEEWTSERASPIPLICNMVEGNAYARIYFSKCKTCTCEVLVQILLSSPENSVFRGPTVFWDKNHTRSYRSELILAAGLESIRFPVELEATTDECKMCWTIRENRSHAC